MCVVDIVLILKSRSFVEGIERGVSFYSRRALLLYIVVCCGFLCIVIVVYLLLVNFV